MYGYISSALKGTTPVEQEYYSLLANTNKYMT